MRLSLDRLACDRRGVAAVEFALLLPILALLYFGSVELTQGVMTQERTEHVASTVGDLVAQSSNVTSAQLTDIFKVGDTVMYPYPTSTLKQRVSSLQADSRGAVKVVWSKATGGLSPLAAGSSVSGLPANVVQANESLVMAESQDTYTSAFSRVVPNPVVFNQKAYLHPRLSTQVTCGDC
ncbi:MAG TPA: TadE/TadG family type IV pilus assembly protein [Caulobacteraceae bacterium]|jgi:Flp pilus assembly protein TadG|nr:TadE/TadG family type IV pilus assembly protein [Caulobacteraceae bacterium]